MTTRAAYTLLAPTERSAVHDGPIFPVGGRTQWAVSFRVAQVTSVTVEIQVSGFGTDDADFETIHTETITTRSTVTRSHDELDGEVGPEDRLIRAVVTANTGVYVLQVVARSPFLDPHEDTDTDLLPKRMRALSTPDRARLIERAEGVVLAHVLDQDSRGRMDANLLAGDAITRMKQAIAIQSEHEMKRDQNMADQEAAETFASGRPRMPLVAVGVAEALGPLQAHAGAVVWRGRG